jgi:hypothetical protein
MSMESHPATSRIVIGAGTGAPAPRSGAEARMGAHLEAVAALA